MFLVIAATITLSASPLSVFVPNTDQGLCWWVCAESILKTNGVDRSLTDEVIRSGRTEASISNAEQYLGIELVPVLNQALERMERGTHVIATIKEVRGRHAVVLIDVRGSNVVYWNPNRPDRYLQMPYRELSSRWVIGTVIK